jgi:hypothetical protein
MVKPAAGDLNRANYASRKFLKNHDTRRRDVHPKALAEIEQGGESSGLRRFT